jgi:hypothetical protein
MDMSRKLEAYECPDSWFWRELCSDTLRFGTKLSRQTRSFVESIRKAIDFDPVHYPTERQKFWVQKLFQEVMEELPPITEEMDVAV